MGNRKDLYKDIIIKPLSAFSEETEEKKEADTKGKALNFSGTYTYNLGLVELKFNPAMTEHGQHETGLGASAIVFQDFTLLGGGTVDFKEPEIAKK